MNGLDGTKKTKTRRKNETEKTKTTRKVREGEGEECTEKRKKR